MARRDGESDDVLLQAPQSREAEQAVVGSILIDPDAVLACRGAGLKPEDFFNEQLGTIYKAALEIADEGKPVDIVTISGRVEGKNEVTYSMLVGLINAVPTSIHAVHYAGEVMDHARRRRVLRAAQQIAGLAYDQTIPVADMLARSSAAFFEAADVTEHNDHLIGSDGAIEDYLANQIARAELLKNNPHALLDTGIPALDDVIGPLDAGQMLVVGARTSTGKTAFMETVAENIALRGHVVAFYHLELSTQRMLDRQMARWSGVSLQDIQRGVDDVRIQRAVEAVRARLCNMVYVHCPGWTAERIAADAAQLRARYGVDLIVVDYLGKIAYGDYQRGFNEASMIAQQVETLKIMAERLGVPVILGSQVNREFKATADKRPTLNDLKGSGGIEEKANAVVILYEPNPRVPGATSVTLEAHVEKNEGGPCGTVMLEHALGRFRVYDPAPEPEWKLED